MVEAAAQFESGHVCRNCESHLAKLPGGEFHWCLTCGAETHKAVADICICGAKVGKHDALLRCAKTPKWAEEPNLLLRRKVRIDARGESPARPVVLKLSRAELFEDEPED